MNMMLLALALTCADMTAFQMSGTAVTITKAEKLSDNLPARCRVDGVIDQRTGAGGKPYGIGFAVALPDNWNGRFLFQGGGGLNGNVANPVGAQASGDLSALSRGFAIVENVKNWSRLFLVPGMGHCQGGTSTVDSFDMLTAITNWVENGKAPDSITAKSRTQPSCARPLCAYPSYAQYSNQGESQDAANFVCRN